MGKELTPAEQRIMNAFRWTYTHFVHTPDLIRIAECRDEASLRVLISRLRKKTGATIYNQKNVGYQYFDIPARAGRGTSPAHSTVETSDQSTRDCSVANGPAANEVVGS